MTKRGSMVKEMIKNHGFFKTMSFIVKFKTREVLDKFVLNKDSKNPIDLPSHSVEANREFWNYYYDWSSKGEEWTDDVRKYKGLEPSEWKSKLVNEVMLKYIQKNSVILEIGPGGGRWTEFLQKQAKHLVLADITQKCLDICQSRFFTCKNIEYRLIKNNLNFVDKNSIDFIWSYDVFVHINPTDIEKYLIEIKRILKKNGIAIIHHTGSIHDYDDKKDGWKTFMGKNDFAKLINKHKMNLVEQNLTMVHYPGDVISIFSNSDQNE